MIVKTDDKKRVVLPNAKPGDVFKVESSIEGHHHAHEASPGRAQAG
jgi:hypothetical protein